MRHSEGVCASRQSGHADVATVLAWLWRDSAVGGRRGVRVVARATFESNVRSCEDRRAPCGCADCDATTRHASRSPAPRDLR